MIVQVQEKSYVGTLLRRTSRIFCKQQARTFGARCPDTWFLTPRASAEESNTLEKHSELSFIALHQKRVTRNSFTELLKSLLTLWVLEETRQTSTMFSVLKALVDSEKF